MNQDGLRRQMDLLAQDAWKRIAGRQISSRITHTNTIKTVYQLPRRRRRRGRGPQRGEGLLGILGKAAGLGYKLGKDKRYKRMGALGATGHYEHVYTPWEV